MKTSKPGPRGAKRVTAATGGGGGGGGGGSGSRSPEMGDGRHKRVWKACERCRMKKTKVSAVFSCFLPLLGGFILFFEKGDRGDGELRKYEEYKRRERKRRIAGIMTKREIRNKPKHTLTLPSATANPPANAAATTASSARPATAKRQNSNSCPAATPKSSRTPSTPSSPPCTSCTPWSSPASSGPSTRPS